MSLTNPKIFGLHVKSSLADVRDKGTALRNLGINPLDLEIIRGSAPTMRREDWISFSRLKQPLYKLLDRYSSEASIFNQILLERAGTDQTLFGNLDINGSISGNAVRYRFLDGSNPARIADISTSRVSAWSSSDPRATDPDLAEQAKAKISYGARVGINTGGKLIFGIPFDVNAAEPLPRLQTTLVPELREFESEIPTSKIKCNINGNTVYLYAMKGIPLVFKGTFRKFSSEIKIVPPVSAPNLLGNWKIVEVRNPNRFSSYVKLGTTSSSSISYNSVVARDRFIQFYYPPDNITGITLTSVRLKELPNVKLSACLELNFSSNELTLFPNFKFIAPILRTLSISNNLFFRADDEIEQSFVPQVAERIPSSLRTLNMSGCFKGSINRNIIPKFLPNLTTLSFSGGRSPFAPDNRSGGTYVQTGNKIVVTSELHGLTMVPNNNTVNIDFLTSSTSTVPADQTNQQVTVTSENTFEFFGSSNQTASGTCNITYSNHNNAGNQSFCPDIPETVVSYDISSNDFRSVDKKAVGTSSTVFSNGSYTFKTAPFLTSLNVTGNRSLDDSDSGGDSSLACRDTIKSINYSSTGLKIPSNLANAPSLQTYSASNNSAQVNQLVNPSTGNYAFEGCLNLTSLSFYESNLGLIPFPNFSNPKLIELDLRRTGIQGGRFGNSSKVIHATTFAQCSELETLRIESTKLLDGVGIDENAFASNLKLRSFTYLSSNRTNGQINQLFKNNEALRTLNLKGNAFDGTIPNFLNNPLINDVDLSNNNFTGNIPGFTNLKNLRKIRLENNNCTSISSPELLENLYNFHAHNNNLSGSVPDFSTCPQLRELTLNNNLFTSYTSGSIATLTRINFIDLSNCKLGQTAQNAIIDDLKLSYDNGNRSRLVINLRGNSSPTDPNLLTKPSTESLKIARDLVRVSNWTIVVNGGLGTDEPEE